MQNLQVVNAFLEGKKANNGRNLWTYAISGNGYNLQVIKQYNAIIGGYTMPMWKKSKKTLFINSNYLHYSKTTQTIINMIMREAEKNGDKIIQKNFTSKLEHKLNNKQ